MMLKLLKISRITFLLGMSLYAVIAVIYLFNLPEGNGDEIVFMRDLTIIKDLGWIEAIKGSISIPYMILAYPLALVFKNYIALRIVNIAIVGAMFFYFKKRNQGDKVFYAYIVFYLATTLFFFQGTNDALFAAALIVFLNEVYLLEKRKLWNGALALSSIIIALFTRELIIVFMPVVLYGLYIIYKHKAHAKFNWTFPIITLLLMLLLNAPIILEKGKLSYDLKSPPENVNASWAQKQYLAQLLVNKGELPNFSHPSWQATDAYLEKNGENSLPKGILEGVFFDIPLTIKEFFKDLYYAFFFGFRQLGLMLYIPLFFLARYLVKNRKIESRMYIPMSLVFMLCAFSAIIISYIEARWFAPMFIMTIVFYSGLEKELKIPNTLVLANYLVLILFTLYGGFRF